MSAKQLNIQNKLELFLFANLPSPFVYREYEREAIKDFWNKLLCRIYPKKEGNLREISPCIREFESHPLHDYGKIVRRVFAS
jgi:hypothetical protein